MSDGSEGNWTVLGRDLWPLHFLEHIWSGRLADGSKIKPKSKVVGFKSFPEHWRCSYNEDIFQELMNDHTIKKIILHREDELAVYLSMMRAEKTGMYMSVEYPRHLKVHIDPAKFQTFVFNYRDTFQRKYKSPFEKRDTFWITYEQLLDKEHFNESILPLLLHFLDVDADTEAKQLSETVKQSPHREDISQVISNYEELEFCFRHTDVYFPSSPGNFEVPAKINVASSISEKQHSWTILLPICSRLRLSEMQDANISKAHTSVNRHGELERRAEYAEVNCEAPNVCWERLKSFSLTVRNTTISRHRKTEIIVGIDEDDPIFNTKEAKHRIDCLFDEFERVIYVSIPKRIYGKVCRIWNRLARNSSNDFIVLMGDDILLHDKHWQEIVERSFCNISFRTSLPFGAGCVALNDLSFKCFPTFPVVHRWHLNNSESGDLLPKQFINQGGDPYLFELYSRWNASEFAVFARMENLVGGDDSARYLKCPINWPGQILSEAMKRLHSNLNAPPMGICIDVVVPSYRLNNIYLLEKIVHLRSSVHVYVRFWLVVDNPDPDNIKEVKAMGERVNGEQFSKGEGNYFVRVVHYGENRGASYARNTGFNYSCADWVLFLDDDVVPDEHILDAYIGAIKRCPEAKVMVGLTVMPPSFNFWTRCLEASNVMYFYGVAKHRTHPPWGVTANLLVRGSRYHHTIQFKDIYPKTGGGEDIDLIFQIKERHNWSRRTVVAVPGAKVLHPWWNNGNICYKQIIGWAWGDSICLTEWGSRTFFTFPNWIEFIVPAIIYCSFSNQHTFWRTIKAVILIICVDHCWKSWYFFNRKRDGLIKSPFVALIASSVISCQEATRLLALMQRLTLSSYCRRMDWFDGQAQLQVTDIQIQSLILFLIFCFLVFIARGPPCLDQSAQD